MQNQLRISLELMYLMDWLLEFGRDELGAMIKKAVASNLMFDGTKIDRDVSFLYDSTVKFFEFLENSVANEFDKNYLDLDFSEDDFYISMRDKLDSSSIDYKTIWMSIKKVKFKAIQRSSINKSIRKKKKTTDEFFKQVIRDWKPGIDSPSS